MGGQLHGRQIFFNDLVIDGNISSAGCVSKELSSGIGFFYILFPRIVLDNVEDLVAVVVPDVVPDTCMSMCV